MLARTDFMPALILTPEMLMPKFGGSDMTQLSIQKSLKSRTFICTES
jgi:hypothetical protein